MNNVQILKQMQKQHNEVRNNIEQLDTLKLKCSTEIGTDTDKKVYNKLLKNTLKTFKTLEMSYNMLIKQKINFPSEFIEIGVEIKSFKDELSNFKKL